MKPHMIITPADVVAAKLRSGGIVTIHLNRKPGSSLHTDQEDKCMDMACPCWTTCPALPEDRECLDILTPFDETEPSDEDDDFRSGLGDAYISWYDSRYLKDRPVLTCDGLVAFMTSARYEGESERRRLGWIAGTLIAYGESNPAFMTVHECAPAQAED